MVCASLWLPGIPETLRFPEEQPLLGLAESESFISAKHTEVLTKTLLWKHKMTPSSIYFAKPQGVLVIC